MTIVCGFCASNSRTLPARKKIDGKLNNRIFIYSFMHKLHCNGFCVASDSRAYALHRDRRHQVLHFANWKVFWYSYECAADERVLLHRLHLRWFLMYFGFSIFWSSLLFHSVLYLIYSGWGLWCLHCDCKLSSVHNGRRIIILITYLKLVFLFAWHLSVRAMFNSSCVIFIVYTFYPSLLSSMFLWRSYIQFTFSCCFFLFIFKSNQADNHFFFRLYATKENVLDYNLRVWGTFYFVGFVRIKKFKWRNNEKIMHS